MIDVKDLKRRMNEYELTITPSINMYFDIRLQYEYEGWNESVVGYRLAFDENSVELSYHENGFSYPTPFKDVKYSSADGLRVIMMNMFIPHMMGITEDNIDTFDPDKFELKFLYLVRTDTKAVYEFDNFLSILKQCFK